MHDAAAIVAERTGEHRGGQTADDEVVGGPLEAVLDVDPPHSVGPRRQLERLESGDPFLLRSLAAPDFATILPRSIIALEGPPIEVRSLRPAIVLPVVLAWRPQHDVSPAARAFVDYILDEVATGAEIGPPVPGPVTEP